MGAMASQITSLTIVYSTVHSGPDQRNHQSSASLTFVWGIHRWPGNSPHKWPVTQKMFPFDDVIMQGTRYKQPRKKAARRLAPYHLSQSNRRKHNYLFFCLFEWQAIIDLDSGIAPKTQLYDDPISYFDPIRILWGYCLFAAEVPLTKLYGNKCLAL